MAQEITVMTRDLYIGAEIQSLAAAETPEDFFAGVQAALEQIAANNFPERAVALAAEIVDKNPHLVGLQEVYNFTINGGNSLPPFRDYLNDLRDALEDQGASYYVAATVKNLDFSLTFGMVEVSIIDRDVILAREDVLTEVVDLTGFCPEKQSVDGCNYQVVAEAITPVGLIVFQRGYVTVNAWVEGFPFRLINTHLEVRNPDPTTLASSIIQAYQASELIYIIGLLHPFEEAPVFVVGDINSSPEDLQIFPWQPPYMQFEASYLDAWTLRSGKPKGFTCCYDEDLSIPTDLYERIDMIFSSELPSRVKATVVGNDEASQTPSGLWPSDHAGVVDRMEFAP
jgi:hypothetical protein